MCFSIFRTYVKKKINPAEDIKFRNKQDEVHAIGPLYNDAPYNDEMFAPMYNENIDFDDDFIDNDFFNEENDVIASPPASIESPIKPNFEEDELINFETDEKYSNLECFEDINSFKISKRHFLVPIIEICSTEELGEEFNAQNLIKIFDETTIGEEELKMFTNYSNSQMFYSTQDMRSYLSNVIDFAEGKICGASKDLKNMLRFITKQLLKDKTYDPIGTLGILAQNGSVCNVMKETAIRNLYNMFVGSLAEELESKNLDQTMYRLLRNLRETLGELCYQKKNQLMNTHNIVGYTNSLAPFIGLNEIPDEHSSKTTITSEEIDIFFALYTPEKICQIVSDSINIQPRKIKYELIIDWATENPPSSMDPYEFLELSFDGSNFNQQFILYLLSKLNVVVLK